MIDRENRTKCMSEEEHMMGVPEDILALCIIKFPNLPFADIRAGATDKRYHKAGGRLTGGPVFGTLLILPLATSTNHLRLCGRPYLVAAAFPKIYGARYPAKIASFGLCNNIAVNCCFGRGDSRSYGAVSFVPPAFICLPRGPRHIP